MHVRNCVCIYACKHAQTHANTSACTYIIICTHVRTHARSYMCTQFVQNERSNDAYAYIHVYKINKSNAMPKPYLTVRTYIRKFCPEVIVDGGAENGTETNTERKITVTR